MAGLVKRAKRAVRRVTAAGRLWLLEDSPPWLRHRVHAPLNHLDMLVLDFGVFRALYLNKHKVAAGVWRSAQPAPWHIRKLARDGVRTVINLRGDYHNGSYRLEREACARYGMNFIDFRVRSRAAPTREEVRAARDLFETAEYPVLIHCKSGADRAGLMSALYLIFKEGKSVEEAKSELSLRYGHIRQADTGVLDYFFERYLTDTAERPMPFMEWVETVYDPGEAGRTFRANGWANRLVNGILKRE
jgi:uncharacterized protein (TIGR01244 family)